MKTKLLCVKMALSAFACFVSICMFGQTQITDEAGLKAIANNLSGSYILMNDITLTGAWTPIGNDASRFTGEINGNGKTIYGLRCQYSEKDSIGFIGVAQDAIIKNLRIVGAEVYGRKDVGILMGTSFYSRVMQCYTSGAVSGVDHVGGLIGGTRAGEGDLAEMYTVVSDCFSTAAVVSTSWQSGGIIGAAVNADVSNTYFAGVAVCKSGRSAGIIALLDGGAASIKYSVVMSPYIKGDESNAILGGENEVKCQLSTNYSWDETQTYQKDVQNLDRVSDPSGFEGQLVNSATLKSVAFYMDDLAWDSDIWKAKEGSYPLFEGQSYPLKGDGIYVPVFAERILPGTTFSAVAISALGRAVSYNSSNPEVATIDSEGLATFIKDGVTTFTFTTVGDDYSEGVTVTREITVKGISYNITNEEDLRCIKYDLAGSYTLMNNITLKKDWELLGKFTGTFNGNGKVIYGLKYNNEEKGEVGLFGEAEGATITKLGIEEANIVGNQNVGAIVGKAYGCTISECYVANSYIAGRDHIGSIVGELRDLVTTDDEGVTTSIGTVVSNCHSGASVYSREYQAGGIAGTTVVGTIEKCYFSGKVQAQKGRATGIVSLVDGDGENHIKNNINLAAAIYCPENTYRIVEKGERVNTTLENNWSVIDSYLGSDQKNSATKDNESDPTSYNGCNVNDDSDARSKSFYTGSLGWDFENTWKFEEDGEGKIYPVLKWQSAPMVSTIYGIPTPAYLIWVPGVADASIDLRKIIASCGQKLLFDVVEGNDLAVVEGDLLMVAEEVSQRGTAKVKMTLLNPELANLFTMVGATDFNVDVMMSGDVFEINTVSDLLNVNNLLFASFRLMKNIDMSGVAFEGFGSDLARFTGTFDGNGYSILNPVVITKDGNRRGLFNATDGAKISKLGVINFSFSGSKTSGSNSVDLGGLVGSCKNTTIDQCYLTGKVVGRDHVGGLVGGECTNVTITNCYVDAEIEAYSQVGGLFGVTAGDNIVVKNSYFAGSVKATGYGWAGGFIGLIDLNGTINITNCASIGDVSGPSASGAFIGGNGTKPEEPKATIIFNGNMSNMDATINSNIAWVDQTVDGGMVELPAEKSSLALKYKATYPNWDFDNIWAVVDGTSYPKLKNAIDVGISTEQMDKNNYTVIAADNVIRVSGIKDIADVTLYNINGQIISHVNAAEGNVDLPVFGKGFYIVRITENNTTTSVKVINK